MSLSSIHPLEGKRGLGFQERDVGASPLTTSLWLNT